MLPKKLLYKGSVYRLARTSDDIAWERVAELSGKLHAIASNKSLASMQKRERAGFVITELKEHLKHLGLYAPAV